MLASISDPPEPDRSQLDDDALVAAWREGSDEAFCQLVGRHGPPLLGFLQQQLGDPRKAEDAWSETWLRLVRARDRYVAEGHFRAWLYTVARRCAKDQSRGFRRWTRLAVKLFERTGPRHDEATADLALIADERTRRLDSALEQLSEEHRTVVLLTYRQDLSSAEVGEVLGLTGQQVRSRLTYARTLLGRLMADEGSPAGSSEGPRGGP
jgi:RNA polymerase sigma-70 factor, ECF subfamily